MGSADLKTGDLVWAKMKGYPHWPARIVEPISNIKAPKNKKCQFVCLFGSRNFAWIPKQNIHIHSESVFDTVIKKRNKAYQCAIDELMQELGSSSKSMPVRSSPKRKKKAEIKKKMVKKEEPDFIGEGGSESNIDEDDNSVSSSQSIEPLIHFSQIKIENRKRTTEVVKILKKRGRKPLEKVNERRSMDSDIDGKSPPGKKAIKREPVDIAQDTPPQKKKYMEKTVEKIYGKTMAASSNSEKLDVHDDLDREDESSEDSYGLETFKPRNIGFIGLDAVGKLIVETFLKSYFDVTLFNGEDSDKFVDLGAKLADSPAEMVVNCDITFCNLDPNLFRLILTSKNGILEGFDKAKNSGLGPKGCVCLNSIDYATSVRINEAISLNNGLYLEAPICGTCEDILCGKSVVVASGDKKLFRYCKEYFNAISQNSIFVSCEIGKSSELSVVLNTINSAMHVAIAEATAFAEKLGISKMNYDNPLINVEDETEIMIDRNFEAVTPMKYVRKSRAFAQKLADSVSQHQPVTAAVNELYNDRRFLKYSESDVTSVYKILKY